MVRFERIAKIAFWLFLAILVVVCSFFIVHNAHWIIGDDYEIIRKTGSGIPFKPTDTIKPANGRFFPSAYLVYNILLLFFHGHIFPQIHYALHALLFVVFVFSMAIIFLKMMVDETPIWKYTISAAGVMVSVCVVYPHYLECYSTVWCGYSLLAVYLLLSYMFSVKGKWVYGILALLVINYFCYGCENHFVIPLSAGLCALCFQRSLLSKKEKVYNWLLLASGLLYLLLYAIIVLPRIESVYDASHGESVGLLGNALNMAMNNKILFLVFACFVVRFIDVLKNKKAFLWFDIMLFSAVAGCCGNFVLKLNWPLYYKVSLIVSFPSLVYFSVYYLRERWTFLLLVCFMLLLGRKDFSFTKKNQRHRIDTYYQITNLSQKIDESDGVYWYAPYSEDNMSFNITLRNWKYKTICTYLGWLRYDSEFSIVQRSDFQCIDNTIWVNPLENELLVPNDSSLVNSGMEFFYADGFQAFWIPNCDNK